MERKQKKRTGVRADRLISERFPTLTSRQGEEAFESGLILDSAGKRVKKGDRFDPEETLDSGLLSEHLLKLKAGNAELKIEVVANNPDWLAIDKPPGIPSHPLSLFDHETVTHWAFHHYPKVREAFSETQPTITPHRLDTATSGLLIVTLTKEAYEIWRARFKQHECTKVYLAWCWGKHPQEKFVIENFLAHDPKDFRRMVVAGEGIKFRPPTIAAKSEVELVKVLSDNGPSLYRVTCNTGVTHQVRVQLAAAGLPLVGDELYDEKFANRSKRAPFHQLRAVELSWGKQDSQRITVSSSSFAESPSFTT